MVKIIAHRGAMAKAPENTKSAFDIALDHGVSGFETDLQVSGDNTLVVYHDETTSRLGDDTPIRNQDMAALQALDNGGWHTSVFAGEKILTLKELLSLYGDRTDIYLELKSYGQADLDLWAEKGISELKTLLSQARCTSQISILSFERSLLQLCKEQMPEIPLVLNVNGFDDEPVREADFSSGYRALCFDINELEENVARRIISRKHEVMCYGVNDEPAYKKALACNVSLIMTDDPEWFYASGIHPA